MMNPWDRERTFQESPAPQCPARGAGLWLVAVVIAVIALALLGRHGANNIVVIPIGISLFFMVMFLFSHRREVKRNAWQREVARLHSQSVTVPTPQPAAVDTTLRKVFDRFDVKVIAHGRSKFWQADKIAAFLDYARDYVDSQHASALMNGNEKGELDRHLDASLQKALLQHDIEHKEDPASDVPF